MALSNWLASFTGVATTTVATPATVGATNDGNVATVSVATAQKIVVQHHGGGIRRACALRGWPGATGIHGRNVKKC